MRRKESEILEFDVIKDLGSEDYAPDGDDWFLVHPEDALRWVATGKFSTGPEDPVLPWWRWTIDSDYEVYEESGRLELAEELLSHSIANGRIRLFQVDNLGTRNEWRSDKAPRLLMLAPEKIADHDVTWNRDDTDLGFTVNVPSGGDDDNESDWVELKECYFLWKEVVQIRPDRRKEEQNSAPIGSNWVMTTAHGSPGLPARGIVPQTQSAKGRRGRKPRHYGAPIASFLARAVREGLENAAREKDETLGYWLLEEYAARGDTNPPDIRNASSDARGALDTWISAVAQKAME